MKPVVSRQHLMTELLIFEIDGSDVTTSYAATGLDYGSHLATIKKGSAADSNLVTIRLRNPLGLVPKVIFQPLTVDCTCRLDAASTKQIIQVRTLTLAGSAKKDDADFVMMVYGTRELREGNYG